MNAPAAPDLQRLLQEALTAASAPPIRLDPEQFRQLVDELAGAMGTRIAPEQFADLKASLLDVAAPKMSLTFREAAARCGFSLDHLYCEARAGRLRTVRPGGGSAAANPARRSRLVDPEGKRAANDPAVTGV